MLQTLQPTPSLFRRGWAFACREPLVHFALGGGLIFWAYWLWAAPEPDTIVVSPQTAQTLIERQSQLAGRPLTAAERAAVVAQFVDEQLLLREASKQGLDRSDPQIRERLADKMRFLLGGEPPTPTREQLARYLAANRARFPEGTLDDLAPTLKEQWVASQRDETLQQSLARLRKQYRIELPAGVKP